MKEQLMNKAGDFTWDFGQNFFIETPIGNCVWSDPDYYGDSTICSFNGTIQNYFGEDFDFSDKEFIDDFTSIVKDNWNKEELTDFDIFQALDRTSVLINMVSETLGSVFIPEEDGGLDDVLPAVKKHYKLLENVQENLMELCQQLGSDLDDYEKGKTNEK